MAAISSALLAALKAGDEVISTASSTAVLTLDARCVPNMGIVVRKSAWIWRESRLSSRAHQSPLCGDTDESNASARDIHKAVAFAKKQSWSPSSTIHSPPVLQNPSPGYDMVVHSATKALAATRISSPGAAGTRNGWSASGR